MKKYQAKRKVREYNSNGKSNENESLTLYLREIAQYPLLSRDEENKYAREAQDGNLDSKKRLIKSNLRFVVHVAKKYQDNGIPLKDLIGEGHIGLIEAVERYDGRGRFTSYAVWWIRQSILKAINERSRLIRLPLDKANLVNSIEKVTRVFQKERGYTPSIPELAKEFGEEESKISELLVISKNHISLEEFVIDGSNGDNGDEPVLIKDKLESPHPTPDKFTMYNDLRENIEGALNTSSKKERVILNHRFGLNGEKPKSLEKIGKLLNLTKERIRQIEKKALKRLKKNAPHLEEYLYD